MNWGNADNFFAMGGYGLYVWGSYVVTAVVMLVEPLLAIRRRRGALRDAAADTRPEDHKT